MHPRWVQKRNKPCVLVMDSAVLLPQNGGSFYTSASSVLIDPFVSPPAMQNQLASELARCEDLVRRDYRYAHLVAGASKMPMSMIWVARNQGGDVNDSDLASLRDVAWNEFVKKRFLPSVAEGTPVADAAASMLEIVRSMNLQRKRFQIMGLHEQVEASELQLVLHLCQAGLLHGTSEYRITANRFRRHDKFFEAFALAVGAFVCASAPFTLGVATTQLNRSLQYDYKKHTVALFVFVLQQNRALITQSATGLDEDYVARIARLIIVSQDSGVAGHREEECDKKKDCCCNDGCWRSVADSVQRLADRVDRVTEKVDELRERRNHDGGGRAAVEPARAAHLERMVQEMVERRMNGIRESNTHTVETLKRENAEMRSLIERRNAAMETKMQNLTQEFRDLGVSGVHTNQEFMQRLQESFNMHSKNLGDDVASGKSELADMKLELRRIILEDREKLNENFRHLEQRVMEEGRAFRSQTHSSLPAASAAQSQDLSQITRDALNENWERVKSVFRQEIENQIRSEIQGALETGVTKQLNERIIPEFTQLRTIITEKISELQANIASITNMHGAFSAQQSHFETALQGILPVISQLSQYVTYDNWNDLSRRLLSTDLQVSQFGDRLARAEDRLLMCEGDVSTLEGLINEPNRQVAGRAPPPPPPPVVKREAMQPEEVRRVVEEVFNQHIRQPETISFVADAVGNSRVLNSRIDLRINAIEARLIVVENLKSTVDSSQLFTVFGNEQTGARGARYTTQQTQPQIQQTQQQTQQPAFVAGGEGGDQDMGAGERAAGAAGP